jgi:hypothetical protein
MEARTRNIYILFYCSGFDVFIIVFLNFTINMYFIITHIYFFSKCAQELI